MASLHHLNEMQSNLTVNNLLTQLNPFMSHPPMDMSPMGLEAYAGMPCMPHGYHGAMQQPPVPQVGMRGPGTQAPTRMGRPALGDLQTNANSGEESPTKLLFERERQQRQQIQRMAMTESARLEMNIQNINIKKNSQKAAEGPMTPNQGEETPKTCEREENPDGSIRYDFSTGLPGGVCVYFMKGYCGIGNKCRYVHDPTDQGNVVKITGMPYTATVEQVVDFFTPLEIKKEKVTFLTSKEGKQTGSAFIEFESRKDALFALGKDRNFINEHRFVLLYPSSHIEKKWFLDHPMPFSTHATPSHTRKAKAATPPMPTTPPHPLPNSQVLTQLQNLQMLQQQQQQLMESPFRYQQLPMMPGMNPMMSPHHLSPMHPVPMVVGNLPMQIPHPSTPNALIKAEEEARTTPVKQLQFDEADEPCGKTGDLLHDLTRKLRNPTNTLGNLPTENLKIVLKSMGYSESACASLVRDIQRSCHGKEQGKGLPPLVPLSKAA